MAGTGVSRRPCGTQITKLASTKKPSWRIRPERAPSKGQNVRHRFPFTIISFLIGYCGSGREVKQVCQNECISNSVTSHQGRRKGKKTTAHPHRRIFRDGCMFVSKLFRGGLLRLIYAVIGCDGHDAVLHVSTSLPREGCPNIQRSGCLIRNT